MKTYWNRTKSLELSLQLTGRPCASTEATAEELAAIPDARERALRRVARAVGGAERAG